MKTRNPFQFKQFAIQQSRAAMPVTTDACIFGALVNVQHAVNVLDVGTGTGLLSLMLAQRFESAHFTGIELDTESAKDATLNFEQSPWNARLKVVNADFLQWQTTDKFDAIVCNPPFFQGQLPSAANNKRNARHTNTLEQQQMINKMAKLLNLQGQIWLLIPEIHLRDILSYLLHNNLKLGYLCRIKPNPDKKTHLCIVKASFEQQNSVEEELVVYEGGNYSAKTKTLLNGYYLNH
jgi:tRNA1Val (adenine37-N6)-methyltransferase